MKIRLAVAACFAFMVAGTALALPAFAAAPSAESEIRAVLDAQVAAWNRGDVLAFMQGYWKSPQTTFVGAGGVFRGWENVLARYRKAYPNKEAMGALDFSNLEITLLGPRAALVLGRWQLIRHDDRPGGVFTLVLRKFPQGWRIINDHTSVVKPASKE